MFLVLLGEITTSFNVTGFLSTALTLRNPTRTRELTPYTVGLRTDVTVPVTSTPFWITTSRPTTTSATTLNWTFSPLRAVCVSSGVANSRPTLVPAGVTTAVAAEARAKGSARTAAATRIATLPRIVCLCMDRLLPLCSQHRQVRGGA